MNYRDKIYSRYISSHTKNLYGDISLDEIKNQFLIWQSYFGSFLPKDKEALILEIGCGNGGLVYWLQKSGFKKTEGVDISKEQFEESKKFNIKNIYQDDLKNFLKNRENIYDVIFMRDIIEHFNKEEILEILELVNCSLKEGGKIIIQTPNAEGPFGGRYRYWDFTHEISFTEGSICQVLLVSNFGKIRIFPTNPIIHGFKSFIRFILWRIIELILRFYLLVETGSGKGIFTQNLIAVAEKNS